MSEESPKKFVNPWLAKGSMHILEKNSPKVPPSPETSASPICVCTETKVFQEYNVRFQTMEENLSVSVVEDSLRSYVTSVTNDLSIILENEGKLTDSSVMSECKTVGLVNECNNCYQNSVIQVLLFCPSLFSAFCIIRLFSSCCLICAPFPKGWTIPICLC